MIGIINVQLTRYMFTIVRCPIVRDQFYKSIVALSTVKAKYITLTEDFEAI